MPKIRFVAAQAWGGAFVRSWWPAGALIDMGYDAACDTTFPTDVGPGDVVVIHRPLDGSKLGAIRAYREAGVRVLVSEDDDLTRLHETENPGKDRLDLEAHIASIEAADGLIVTTPRLVEVYGGLSPVTYVCPNYLPSWVAACRMHHPMGWRPPAPRIGWAGTLDSHAHDLRYIAPAVPAAGRGAIWSFVGDVRAVALLGVRRFVARPFTLRLHDLYRYMSDCEVGIVPLAPIAFNLAKSHLKALEYMTVGVPVVASRLPEQEALITHGTDGFLASDPDEFARYVQLLVHDEDLRTEMGHKAAERARAICLENMIGCWLDALGLEQPDGMM